MLKNINCPNCEESNFSITQKNDTLQLIFTCVNCESRLITLESVYLGINKISNKTFLNNIDNN